MQLWQRICAHTRVVMRTLRLERDLMRVGLKHALDARRRRGLHASLEQHTTSQLAGADTGDRHGGDLRRLADHPGTTATGGGGGVYAAEATRRDDSFVGGVSGGCDVAV